MRASRRGAARRFLEEAVHAGGGFGAWQCGAHEFAVFSISSSNIGSVSESRIKRCK